MEKDAVSHGFIIKNVRPVPELAGQFWEMEHEKSGARLVWLERKEENKTFGIAFQTQPWDDTGVFHILEHSVLCGSDRYPVKEPFVELMKSSMQTFLNAMTFPDKTFYPVSSRNWQDFTNLMRVYMDAVLHPLLHSKPEIFAQEGWHYELSEDGTLSYKGVVFNEMKGAFASPDTLLQNEMNRRLFPDTCYRFVSGGDPEHIPELTYEQFAAAHSRLYHPSNAYIFLDGGLDIESVLGILDKEYLSQYERISAPAAIPFQKPVNAGTSEITFPLSNQESLEGRARLAEGYVACTFRDQEEQTALQVLADALCGDNQAPLKRKLLESALARDVRMDLHDSIQQPWVSLEARDIRETDVEQVSAALREELERLVKDGLDHSRIMATLDNLEFQARQRDYGQTPQGLVFGMQVLESWLYGGDPAANLSVGDLFDDLRRKCENGYFETLLEKTLLHNPHTSQVLMLPSHIIGQERQEQETARLQTVRAAWSDAESIALRQRQKELEEWQSMPDAPDALALIPMLRLDQVSAEPEELPLEEGHTAGLRILRHTLPTSGITYLNLYFALDDLTAEQLTKASFLCELLGSLDTEAHSMDELQKVQRSLFGGLQFSVESYGCQGQPEECRTFFCVSASMLDTKTAKAVELLAEIIRNTSLNDSNKIYDLLCQRRTILSQKIAMAGHSFAMGRVAACCTAEGAVQEYTDGITYFRWLRELENDFREKFPPLLEELVALSENIFCRKRLTVSITASSSNTEGIICNALQKDLPEGTWTLPDIPAVHPWESRREGIVIPVDVSFAAAGSRFSAAGRGEAQVMSRTISLAYLWNAVRVQGGAYGVGMLVRSSGMAGFYSYRDPNASRTLDCYRQTPVFLENLGETDMTAFILGAVAESEPLLTPRMKGKTADVRYWRGTSRDDLRRIRTEMLAASPESLVKLARSVRIVAEDGAVCILGSQRQIDACAGKLNTTQIL